MGLAACRTACAMTTRQEWIRYLGLGGLVLILLGVSGIGLLVPLLPEILG